MKRLVFFALAALLATGAFAADKLQIMEAGKIKLEYLPTTDFSLSEDPANATDGQIWWNETTKQLKVADTLGVYVFNATELVEWDVEPDAFSFTDITNATTSTLYTSAAITVGGINHPSPISVSGDASAKYSINNATAVSTNGTVSSGDEVRAVVTSSADAGTAVNATVTIGGVSDAFSVTTAADESVACTGAFASGDNESWESGSAASCTTGWTGLPNSGVDTYNSNWSVCGDKSLLLTSGDVYADFGANQSVKYVRFYFKPSAYANITGASFFSARKYNTGGGIAFNVQTDQYVSGSELQSIFLSAASSSEKFVVPYGSELRIELKITDSGSTVDGILKVWRKISDVYTPVEIDGDPGVYEATIIGSADAFRYLYFLHTGNGVYFDDIQAGDGWIGGVSCE